jgi:HD-GYP domain-containing protein (c-di-GMP phosphodiesterase class II)
MRLFRSILLIMLFTSAVPTAIVGLLLASSSREQLTRGSLDLAAERVDRLRVQATAALGEATRAVEEAAQQIASPDQYPIKRQGVLTDLLARFPEIAVVTAWDSTGRRIEGLSAVRSDVVPAEIAEHEKHAAVALAGRAASSEPAAIRLWSPAYSASARHSAVMTLTIPVYQGGSGIGGLAAEIRLDPLATMVSATKVGRRGIAFAVDRTGRTIAHSDPSRVLTQDPTIERVDGLRRAMEGDRYAPAAGVAEFQDPKGQAFLGAYAAVPELGLGLVAGQPREDALASLAQVRRTFFVAAALSMALAVLLSAWFARSITRPVGECVRGALDIARGRFGRQVQVDVKNEIGELAYTFNHMSRELASYDAENKHLIAALETGYLDTIRSLAGAIDAKDPYTHGHNERVAALAGEIGREMKLDDHALKMISYGGVLHDVGKIGIPEQVLKKETPLDEEEKALVQRHPVIGSEIVQGVAFLADAAPGIRSHHERWDGAGYPEGLAGEAIPLIARIINAADTWDACRSSRPYQEAIRFEEVVEIMKRLRGAQIDPAVCDALLKVVERHRGPRAAKQDEAPSSN